MKKMRWVGATAAVLTIASTWAVGCGSDDEPAAPETPGTGGAAGTGGTGGAAEAGPDVTADAVVDVVAEKKEAAPPKEAAAPKPVPCGTDSCQPITGTPLGDIEACCSANTKCGIVPPALANLGSACIEKNQPGNLDTNCPGAKLAGLLDTPGCCTPAGQCANYVDVDQLGVKLPLGCVDPNTPGLPAPDGGIKSCTPSAGEGGTTDAQTDTTTGDAPAETTTTTDAAAEAASEASTGDAAAD